MEVLEESFERAVESQSLLRRVRALANLALLAAYLGLEESGGGERGRRWRDELLKATAGRGGPGCSHG